jgi:hypothetical protein
VVNSDNNDMSSVPLLAQHTQVNDKSKCDTELKREKENERERERSDFSSAACNTPECEESKIRCRSKLHILHCVAESVSLILKIFVKYFYVRNNPTSDAAREALEPSPNINSTAHQ